MKKKKNAKEFCISGKSSWGEREESVAEGRAAEDLMERKGHFVWL